LVANKFERVEDTPVGNADCPSRLCQISKLNGPRCSIRAKEKIKKSVILFCSLLTYLYLCRAYHVEWWVPMLLPTARWGSIKAGRELLSWE